jgi:hypothetical protein
MPVKRRIAKGRIAELGDVTRRYFLDELTCSEAIELLKPKGTQWEYIEEAAPFQQMFWEASAFPSEGEVWQRHGAELLAEFVRRNPGHRPRAWWKFDNISGRPNEGESETEFLKRHDLIQPSEERRLQPEAQEMTCQ